MGKSNQQSSLLRNRILTKRKRCDGPTGLQTILLSTHDHDTRRPDRKAPQVRYLDTTGFRLHYMWTWLLTTRNRYNPAERDAKKAAMA